MLRNGVAPLRFGLFGASFGTVSYFAPSLGSNQHVFGCGRDSALSAARAPISYSLATTATQIFPFGYRQGRWQWCPAFRFTLVSLSQPRSGAAEAMSTRPQCVRYVFGPWRDQSAPGWRGLGKLRAHARGQSAIAGPGLEKVRTTQGFSRNPIQQPCFNGGPYGFEQVERQTIAGGCVGVNEREPRIKSASAKS